MIYINNYENLIPNKELDELLPNVPTDCQISLWDLSTAQTGYGNWKILVELEINGEKETFTTITTNSTVLCKNSGEIEVAAL